MNSPIAVNQSAAEFGRRVAGYLAGLDSPVAVVKPGRPRGGVASDQAASDGSVATAESAAIATGRVVNYYATTDVSRTVV